LGFHSRASFCASTICAGVILAATLSRFLAAFALPLAAARLNHTWARILSPRHALAGLVHEAEVVLGIGIATLSERAIQL